MALLFCLTGMAGFFFCAAFRQEIHDRFFHFLLYLKRKSAKPDEFSTVQEDLNLVRNLIRSLRSGMALDSAIMKLLKDPQLNERHRREMELIQKNAATDSFLFEFLRFSLQRGQPLLQPLLIYAEKLAQILKLRKRILSLAAQAKAQAEILSWLPLTLLFTLFLIDHENLRKIFLSPFPLFLLSLVFCLIGTGKRWVQSMQNSLFLAKNPFEKVEMEILPDLILMLITEVSSGTDALSSWERCRRSSLAKNPDIATAFEKSSAIQHLKNLAEDSASTGAPIKDELLSLLSETLFHTQSKYEERAQQLPVMLLAPLFLCFFPACILSLGIYFFPIFLQS